MAKINEKEYEILKGLDVEWNWIARDEMGVLDCYMKKPKKYKLILKFWSDNTSPPKFIDGSNFQFVQWEDKEPYNIQELIEEYESEYHIENAKIVNIDASKLTPWTPNPLDFESEETEVKKDKKWLVDKWTKERNEADVYDPMYQFISEFIADVNQLDEPEVLSQDWIDDNKKYEGVYDIGYYIPVNKLQNLLVPKNEDLESKIKVLIEAYEQEDGQYSNPENAWIAGFIGDLENLVEEEQKYNVKFKVKSSFGTVGIFLYKKGDEVLAGDNFQAYYPKEDEYRLTEQEIRGFQNGDILFEHFAVKVEEMEQ